MTIFDHLRECAANGDTPTLDAEDAARIVKTYDTMLKALEYVDSGKLGYTAAVDRAIWFARNPT